MNPSKNSNNNQHNNSTENSTSVIEARLNYYDHKIHTLEDKVVKHEQTIADIADLENHFLQIQETIEIITKNQQQCFDDKIREMDSVSCKYEQTRRAVDKLKKKNDGLKCSIQKMSIKQSALVEQIPKIKCDKKKITERNNILLDKLHEEQVIKCNISLFLSRRKKWAPTGGGQSVRIAKTRGLFKFLHNKHI